MASLRSFSFQRLDLLLQFGDRDARLHKLLRIVDPLLRLSQRVDVPLVVGQVVVSLLWLQKAHENCELPMSMFHSLDTCLYLSLLVLVKCFIVNCRGSWWKYEVSDVSKLKALLTF